MGFEITLPNILSVGGILGFIFSVYHFFRKPQEKLESGQLLAEKELANKATILAQREMEGKASLLASQVHWEKESNEKKFGEYGRKLDEVMMKNQKEVVKIDSKLESFIRTQNQRNEETSIHFTKLFTLLEERLPKKYDT
jgi:hypothetical protein